MTETLLATAPAAIPLTVSGHSFRLIPVRGGAFDMGDEAGGLWEACRPVHSVRLADFCIGQFPVTQALWRAVAESPIPEASGVGASPSPLGRAGPRPDTSGVGPPDPDPSFFKGDRRPVESVSWLDVQVFLAKLNLLLPGYGFRLPTEAEWEYAARGGDGTATATRRPNPLA